MNRGVKSFKEFVLAEAHYKGNIGVMEMVRFYQKATDAEKAKMKSLLKDQKFDEAWAFLQQVTGMKLHPA